MDLTKFFLYTSLAVITYLMLLAWQEDYPPIISDGSQTPNELQLPLTSTAPAPDVPTIAPTSVSTDQAQTSATTLSQGSNNRLISIETDTLALTINLIGGDIVRLALPQYLKQLDVIDVPFLDLDDLKKMKEEAIKSKKLGFGEIFL